ncbi:MAG: LPS export ABC transporter permease LptG [Ectothiorhodospiraceae bacterium]|nr:LPS export ABC transporter permease LptG [Ectothiorhodospiraceae bacterium]
MMRILDRYIAKAVVAGSLVALLVFTSLILIFSFVEESGDVTDEYTAFKALLYVALRAPQRAYESFPIATLIGSLMTLGGLAARHELVVMRAAGMSILGIGRSVAVAGVTLALAAIALGEWVAPPAERMALEVKAQARTGEVAALSQDGFWARDGRRFVQVSSAPSATQLNGVNIYDFDRQRRLVGITSAVRADHDGRGWVLHQVVETRFDEDGGVQREQSLVEQWDSELHPDVLDVVVVDPEALAIRDLWTYIDYLERNDLESDRYRLAFWLKLATPLATLTMLLLTIPLAFGSLRSVGAGQRIFIGVMIGIAFFLGNNLLNHLGLVYGLAPVVSALLPTLIFLAAAIYGTSRIR